MIRYFDRASLSGHGTSWWRSSSYRQARVATGFAPARQYLLLELSFAGMHAS